VTSSVENSQRMTMDFRNNSLNGQSKINENYRTSKTRVCVTVGMMTTGYDCTDLLNLCLMRPVYSPSEFIQMKGRGTRKNNFKFHWISRNEMPEHIDSVKEDFNLFDFFGNYEFFEKEFDYDEKLELPKKPSFTDNPNPPIDITEVINYNDDPLKFIEEISIGDEGMKIDRNLYRSFQAVITEDSTVRNFVNNMEFEKAENYLKENILDKPKEFFTIEKLRKSLELDRKLSVSELLLYAYGHLDRIKNKNECLEEEFEKFDNEFNLPPDKFNSVKEVFESYALDSQYRKIIDEKKLVELNVHYPGAGEVYKNIPSELRDKIPQFIREKVNLERLSSA
jgi:type I restriction enzyme, R subunit